MPLPTPEWLSGAVKHAITQASKTSERTQQSLSGRIGVSDVGHCHEFVRRLLKNEPLTDERDVMNAWLGTVIGAGFEDAMARQFRNARRHVEVTVKLKSERNIYILTGHPDILVGDGVLDGKAVNGLEAVRRNGPSEQQEFQLHLYALGAYQMGLFDKGVELGDVWLSDVWIDRSGREKQVHTNPHPYDPAVIEAAGQWLDDAWYAAKYEAEAQRDKPFEWCKDYCERFTACRAETRPIGGIITDPELITAARLHREAVELKKRAEILDAEAKDVLLRDAVEGQEGISGFVDKEPIRVTWVNGGPKRRGHHRVNS